MTPLRVGIIGVGNIAPVHAAAIQAEGGSALVAVATRHPERGPAFAARYGAAWHADYQDLLRQPEVDVVTICATHAERVSMALAAAQAGKHIWCEKPLARTAAECDTIIAACDRADVRLGVVFQSRFDPLALKCREILQAGRLGRLLWASTSTPWYRDEAYFASKPWRGEWAESGGGVLINQAIHAIDLLVWLVGMPSRVTAQTRTLAHAIEVEDAAHALLEFPGGALGAIQATTVAYPGYPERLEFYGTNGSLVLHKGQGQVEWHLLDPPEDGREQAAISSGAAQPMDISAAGHIAQFKDFAAAVREHRPPRVDGREGRKSVLLVESIYRSAREGRPVDITG
jgi:predicted dehydrogenase